MYNLLEYSKNYRKTTGSLWNYYRDEPNPLFYSFESFKYKKSITGNTYDGNDDANKVGKNEIEILVPLKHLSNFWRTFNIPLVDCEVEMVLTWSINCALADTTVRAAVNDNDSPTVVTPTGLQFQSKDTKMIILVVPLSKKITRNFYNN